MNLSEEYVRLNNEISEMCSNICEELKIALSKVSKASGYGNVILFKHILRIADSIAISESLDVVPELLNIIVDICGEESMNIYTTTNDKITIIYDIYTCAKCLDKLRNYSDEELELLIRLKGK